jgi:3-oxoacyl-[acyl-carrier protein] reductase/bacilysin biosynthesis oxidoreductase BacG
MDLNLQGKSALITGGSAGIGLACARTFVGEGVSVAIASRSAERLAEAEAVLEAIARDYPGATPRVVTIVADLARADDVERTARETAAAFGKIDILVNNAGSAMGGPFLKLPDSAFLDAWTLKLLGYIRMCRAVAPSMIARRDGAIVNIVGGAARTPTPAFLTGSTGNAAIINFTRGLSKELAPHNVRINAISPGITATERAERLLEQEVTGGKTI